MVCRSQVFRKSMQAPGEMGKSEGEGKERSSGSRGLPYPLPIVCKALQISSQPLAFFFNYSFNTIGWGRQKNPVSINGQDDTGSKGNTERSSKVTFIECSECARFPQTHKNISMEHLSLFIFISSLLCSVFRDKADLMSN